MLLKALLLVVLQGHDVCMSGIGKLVAGRILEARCCRGCIGWVSVDLFAAADAYERVNALVSWQDDQRGSKSGQLRTTPGLRCFKSLAVFE